MEKRSIQISIETAKSWYQSGGELKQIALQAFTEKELHKKEVSENNLKIYHYLLNEKYSNRVKNIRRVLPEIQDAITMNIMLHNMAYVYNEARHPEEPLVPLGIRGYFINVIKCKEEVTTEIISHESVKYPGIAYFYNQADAQKALAIIRDLI